MLNVVINDVPLRFETHPHLFSPSQPDKGTLAMLSVANIEPEHKVLDLGCGYGLVGIYTAKAVGCENVVMSDVDSIAVEIARRNARLNDANVLVVQSDGLDSVAIDDFNVILCNPPYHVDFAVPKRFIQGAFNHLQLGGRLVMVTKRRTWYENRMRAVFGGVRVTEKDGYFVFESEKRALRSSRNDLKKKTTKKHAKRMTRVGRK